MTIKYNTIMMMNTLINSLSKVGGWTIEYVQGKDVNVFNQLHVILLIAQLLIKTGIISAFTQQIHKTVEDSN